MDERRIVVLAEEFMLADVLALGLHPVASTASVAEVGFQGIDEFDTSGIEVLPMTTLNLEHVAALRPDVLITLQFWVDQVGTEQLAGMAELITVPDGLDIPARLRFLGEQLGRADEAEAVIAAVYPGPSPAAFRRRSMGDPDVDPGDGLRGRAGPLPR